MDRIKIYFDDKIMDFIACACFCMLIVYIFFLVFRGQSMNTDGDHENMTSASTKWSYSARVIISLFGKTSASNAHLHSSPPERHEK